MTDDEWLAVRSLLRHTFVLTEQNGYGEAKDRAYRLSLDAYDPLAVVAALRRLQREGQKFVPAVADILRKLEDDPTLPTFTEVLTAARACWGGGRALAAANGEPYRDEHVLRWIEANVHPWVAAFFASYGLDTIRGLPLDDPQYGGLERQRFGERWDEWLARAGERVAAGLPIGAAEIRRSLGPARFDAVAALRGAGQARALESGDAGSGPPSR